ncbi:major facilitator transporter [Paenibacillus swuensis]|uniref:Major facilitator transporter n=1 Tax=Paenibacillus swuensis TaxID=1178515 RepID=A0A172TFF9_9BACL|nr:MDR family MFS transporter [Paenibacillus swuensis]ANE45617.1 major facilitator transporter [Paenibacillus swuensis]
MKTTSLQQTRFWPLMFAIFIGSFVCTLSISTINIAIPDLMRELNADISILQWTITGFMLATGTVAPITGFLGDKFSYKRVYVFSLIGFTISSLFCALAWDASSLIAFRVIQGACAGLVMPATMTIIFQVVPAERRAMALSFWSLSAMLAPALGPTLAGWLIQTFSWHWLFVFNIPVGIIASLLAIRLIPYYRLTVPATFDGIGFVTVIAASISILVSFSQGHAWGWDSLRTLGLLGFGIICLALFIWRELVVKEPLLNVRVFKSPRYTLTLIINSIITVSLYSGAFLTPLFLQNIQNVTPLDTGLILLPSSLAMALSMPFVGKLYGTVGPRLLIICGIVLMGVGTLAMSWLNVGIGAMYIIMWMTVRNLGIALTTMPANNAGMEGISRELSGHATAMSNWVRNAFGSFSIALFTSLLASRTASHTAELAAGGQGGVTPAVQAVAFTISVNDVYFYATLIVLVGLPLALLLRKASPLTKTEVHAEKEST